MKNLCSFFLLALFLLSKQQALIAEVENLKVVIFGDGVEGNNIKEKLKKEELTKFFETIKTLKPDAVFYTGSLIAELEKTESHENIENLEENLNAFSEIVNKTLGKDIPLYPVLGNHSHVNARVINTFSSHFNIKKPPSLDFNILSYSVELEDSQFIVMASGNYERDAPAIFKYWKIIPLMDWLKKELSQNPSLINYRFVIGHEPAFSTTNVVGTYLGLDKDLDRRDKFWSVLKKGGVSAYFCSHENLFDRSNRGGVWQVISGGLSSSNKKKMPTNSFNHFILLTIPKEKSGEVTIEAQDLTGKVWDKFTISSEDEPIHQLRIL